MVAFHKFYLGGEIGKAGGILRGGDLRTRGQGRGGLRCLFFWEKGEVAAGWRGGVLEIAGLPPACRPLRPSRKLGVRLDMVVRPAGTLLSPTLSPQALPCPQHTLTTNDPKVTLK